MNRMLRFLAAIAFAGTVVSCKDKNTDETLPSLEGALNFEIPSYVAPGDVLTLIPTGGIHPEGGDYGYYWIANPIKTSRDTTRHIGDPSSVDGRYILTVPDTLCNVNVTAYMYAKGYYSLQAYKTIKIVSKKSISNIPQAEEAKTFEDARDSKVYSYITDGDLEWMSENLSYSGSGRPYSNCEPMTDLFGNLYSWNDASTSCPEGWRLPSVEEWKNLCGGSFESAAGLLMVDAYLNSDKMWEYWPDVDITNSTGMNVIPTGYASIAGNRWSYTGTNEYAVFWTADEYDQEQMQYISIYVDQPDVQTGSAHKGSFAASVRCVRNINQ